MSPQGIEDVFERLALAYGSALTRSNGQLQTASANALIAYTRDLTSLSTRQDNERFAFHSRIAQESSWQLLPVQQLRS